MAWLTAKSGRKAKEAQKERKACLPSCVKEKEQGTETPIAMSMDSFAGSSGVSLTQIEGRPNSRPMSRLSKKSMPKIKIGNISRRPHSRDPRSQIPPDLIPHPTMLSSEVMQRNSNSKVYGYWKQIAGKALEESVNPVGGTTSLRTSQVNDLLQEGVEVASEATRRAKRAS